MFKSKIFFLKNYDTKYIFLIILLFSYLIPILYGILFKPIFQSKYIIFVIIPILIIIVSYLDVIQNVILRKAIILLTILITIINLSTETTIKQFFYDRKIHKPDLKSVFFGISNSQYKDYSFNIEKGNWTSEKNLNDIIKNYSHKYEETFNLNLNYVNFNEIKTKEFLWLICLTDLNKKCDLPEMLKKSVVLKEENFNSVNMKLLKF